MEKVEVLLGALNPAEEKYSYRQSQQIKMQTGFIGHLRADFGSTGKEFFSSWFEFNKALKTQEFSDELDTIIYSLRSKGKLLQDRDTLKSFCLSHPEWRLSDDYGYYGVRINTQNYAYILRLIPRKGDYNLYCHCYVRDRLNNHIRNAEKGIRFIDSSYNEQFRINDGDDIRITTEDGTKFDRTCRYIDLYHVEVGSELYHICQFAELVEKNGWKVEPARQKTGIDSVQVGDHVICFDDYLSHDYVEHELVIESIESDPEEGTVLFGKDLSFPEENSEDYITRVTKANFISIKES